MQPWGKIAGQDLIPMDLIKGFGNYLMQKYVLKKGPMAKYESIFHVFLGVEKLRFLAVPPKLGGPPNQSQFVVFGATYLIVLMLLSLPFAPFQFIAFITSISHIFGYCMGLHTFYHTSYLSLPLMVYITVGVDLLGIVSIIL